MQANSIDRVSEGIKITWQDGHVSVYSAVLLRQSCPCAVCKEIPDRGADGKIPAERFGKNIEVKAAHPVGWYALQFVFSDGHDTGIFAFEFLRKLCPCGDCRNP